MVFYCSQWYCLVLYGSRWYCMVLGEISCVVWCVLLHRPEQHGPSIALELRSNNNKTSSVELHCQCTTHRTVKHSWYRILLHSFGFWSIAFQTPCGHPADSHPAERHPADGHPADWISSRMDIQPTGHPADWTSSRLGHPAERHPADGHPADSDIQPTGHPADWTSSRLDIQPTRTSSRLGRPADSVFFLFFPPKPRNLSFTCGPNSRFFNYIYISYIIYHVMLYRVGKCHTMLYHVIRGHTLSYHVIPCYTMSYHVIPCYTMLYHVIPCYT